MNQSPITMGACRFDEAVFITSPRTIDVLKFVNLRDNPRHDLVRSGVFAILGRLADDEAKKRNARSRK